MGRAQIALFLVVSLWTAAARAGDEGPTRPFYLGEARPSGPVVRVVSLAPNLTEILFALGAGDRVVGVTRFDDYPPQVASLPRVGGFLDPSLEAIAGLKPDLVVCVPNSGNRARMLSLSRIHVPVLVLPSYGLDDLYAAIATLGEALGQPGQARKLVENLRSRAEAVARRAAGLDRPAVLLVYGHKPLVAAGPGSFADALLTLAGGRNVMGDARVRYPTVPIEVVVERAPEVIIDASSSASGSSLGVEPVRAFWARWKVIPAVRDGRVHVVDSALWFRPGPRLFDGLERLERLLHPPAASRGAVSAPPEAAR